MSGATPRARLHLLGWARPGVLPHRAPGGEGCPGGLVGGQGWRLVVLTFLVLRLGGGWRFFPVWKQSVAVLGLLLNDRVVTWMVHGFSGEAMPPGTTGRKTETIKL